MPIFKRSQDEPSPTKPVIGQNPLWSSSRFSWRQYGLVLAGLLILAGGIVLFAATPASLRSAEKRKTTQPTVAATPNPNTTPSSSTSTTSPTPPVSTSPTPPASAHQGFTHVSGTQLVDGNNAPLKLRGANVGGWLEWEGWMWGQSLDYIGQTNMMTNLTSLVGSTQAQQFQTNVETNYVTQADFNAMAADGFNVVRIPFNYTLLFSPQNTFKPAGWTILDNAIAEAKQAHVSVVLDMQEAPCGQSKIFFAGYTGGPTLWQSTACQNNTVAIWQAIAARYSTNTAIMGYDFIGEPSTSDSQLTAFYQRLTAAVRQVDTNHILIYEGNNFARSFTNFTGRLDSDQVLSFHAYTWTQNNAVPTKLATFNPYATAQDSPLYVGEYGQTGYSGLSQYVQGFNGDPYVAGYTVWTWKQVQGLPTLQAIHETAASQKLIDWMDNTHRSKPTVAQANQGMSDFINSIKYQNTTANQTTKQTVQ